MDLNKIINEAKLKILEESLSGNVNSNPDYLVEIIELNKNKPKNKIEIVKSNWYLILNLTNKKYEKGILMLFNERKIFQYEHEDWIIMSYHIDRVVGVPINKLLHFVYGDIENKYSWWRKSDWKPTKELQQELF